MPFFSPLDGVLTKTAEVHAAAWKRVFDGFLAQHAAETGEVFIPFDMDADYRRYVDGKLREDGVASFLQSRGIELPLGTPEDIPGMQTVRALSKLKDQYFIEHLEQHGVETYAPAVSLVRTLRSLEIKSAVVSSIHHCAAVLRA
jgi:beta-phosphoglucomutase-like phosphatase (HAD superfamily)